MIEEAYQSGGCNDADVKANDKQANAPQRRLHESSSSIMRTLPR